MRKKTLIIIISLLVIVDVAAALWYLSLRIEKRGEGHDLWQNREAAATLADTVTTTSIPDSFDVQQFHAYYVSRQPVVPSDLNSYYVSVKNVHARWPKSINGNDSLPALERELLTLLFGGTTPINVGLPVAVAQWLERPKFTAAGEVDYREIETMPKLVGHYAHCDQLLAYPIMTSMRLLVMEVDRYTRNGETTSQSSQYVHYDRAKQIVLPRWSILLREKESALLGLINEKIQKLNTTKRLQLERAAIVSRDFYAQQSGIIFEYAPGALAPSTAGQIQILIDYPLLGPVLTAEFKELLHDNDGYWKYKPLMPLEL